MWLSKPRTWWIRRWISKDIAETVLQHMWKVATAASIYWKNKPKYNYKKLVYMWFVHDIVEYKAPDLTPHDPNYHQRFSIEKIVIDELPSLIKWGDFIRELWLEFEEWVSEEAILIFQLDKFDAIVQAFEYEKQWYDVWDFFEGLWKHLKDPVLKNIYSILLKRKYQHISTYEQYFYLLEVDGDEEKYDRKFWNIN